MRRQAQKNVGGTKTRFIYSGWQRIADYDGSDNFLRRFIYGPGLDEALIELDDQDVPTYLHHDRSGSIVATTDDTGDVVNTYAYSPFGRCDNMSGTSIGYTGQRYDSETGLYYYKNRHYSPSIGRFLQPDPLGYVDGLNLYQYAYNAPLDYCDPLGLESDQNGGPRPWGAPDPNYTPPRPWGVPPTETRPKPVGPTTKQPKEPGVVVETRNPDGTITQFFDNGDIKWMTADGREFIIWHADGTTTSQYHRDFPQSPPDTRTPDQLPTTIPADDGGITM